MPRCRLRAAGILALRACLAPCGALATCQLPALLPPGARPAGATAGPGNSLVLTSDGGTILFVDLEDYAVREDTALNDKYTDAYGWFDLEGVAMTETSSRLLYLIAQGKDAILEYDWQFSRRILRRFTLPGFEQVGTVGAESLTFVPSEASTTGGYFYVGSQIAGQVFVYELPLQSDTGVEATAKLISVWTPLEGSKDVASLSYSAGYLFVNYDAGFSTHVLIYPVLPSGLAGDLAEQYQVDVANAEGMVARQRGDDSWEVFFTSVKEPAIFAYDFRFVSGFAFHRHCAARAQPLGAAAPSRWRTPSGAVAVLLLALSSVHVWITASV